MTFKYLKVTLMSTIRLTLVMMTVMLLVHVISARNVNLACNINHKTSTQCDQLYQDHRMEISQKFECEDQLDQDPKHECDQSKHDLDIEHVQRLQQREEDENLALDLQRC